MGCKNKTVTLTLGNVVNKEQRTTWSELGNGLFMSNFDIYSARIGLFILTPAL
jgi:hypothetical protein